MKLTMKLTTPKVNLNWWNSSKDKLVETVEKYHRDAWPTQRDPVTLKPWAPRKPPTGSWPLLRKTGLMQQTASFRYGKNPMTFVATTTDYGPFLQFGTKFMVQRRWLGIGPKMLDPMARIIGQNIFKGKTIQRFVISS